MTCPWARHFTLLVSGVCPCIYCKSLWIRASAKLLNVNGAALRTQWSYSKTVEMVVDFRENPTPPTLDTLFQLLPFGRRLRSIRTKTSRHKNSYSHPLLASSTRPRTHTDITLYLLFISPSTTYFHMSYCTAAIFYVSFLYHFTFIYISIRYCLALFFPDALLQKDQPSQGTGDLSRVKGTW